MDPQLFALQRDFFALVPTNKLKFPEDLSLSRLNSFFMEDILLDRHYQKYPAADQYQIGFWKWAIQHLEELVRHIPEDEVCSTAQDILHLASLSTNRKMQLLRLYTNITSVCYRGQSGKRQSSTDTSI